MGIRTCTGFQAIDVAAPCDSCEKTIICQSTLEMQNEIDEFHYMLATI